jgi:hypothetical protein
LKPVTEQTKSYFCYSFRLNALSVLDLLVKNSLIVDFPNNAGFYCRRGTLQ